MLVMPALMKLMEEVVGIGILLGNQATVLVMHSDQAGVIGPYCVTPVGVHGWAKVPTINAMGCPTVVYTGFFMDDDAGARGSNGCAIEIKGTMELGPGR